MVELSTGTSGLSIECRGIFSDLDEPGFGEIRSWYRESQASLEGEFVCRQLKCFRIELKLWCLANRRSSTISRSLLFFFGMLIQWEIRREAVPDILQWRRTSKGH